MIVVGNTTSLLIAKFYSCVGKILQNSVALMKPYFDAGLKSLAEACGYPVPAIKSLKRPTSLFLKHGRLYIELC